MIKTIIVAAVSLALGTLLGVAVRHLLEWRKRRAKDRRRRREATPAPDKKKMGTMDKVLIFEAVVLISYTVADLVIFYHVGAEPTTLTACVFGVCGFENGVMGWIKTNKDKANEPSGRGRGAAPPEPPVEREEPPDVGL